MGLVLPADALLRHPRVGQEPVVGRCVRSRLRSGNGDERSDGLRAACSLSVGSIVCSIVSSRTERAAMAAVCRARVELDRSRYPRRRRSPSVCRRIQLRALAVVAIYHASRVILHYLRLVFVPWPLVLDYDWSPASVSAAIVPVIVVTTPAAITGWALLRRHPLAFPAAVFFLSSRPDVKRPADRDRGGRRASDVPCHSRA